MTLVQYCGLMSASFGGLVGREVIMEGHQYRGVIKKVIGRKVHIEFKGRANVQSPRTVVTSLDKVTLL